MSIRSIVLAVIRTASAILTLAVLVNGCGRKEGQYQVKHAPGVPVIKQAEIMPRHPFPDYSLTVMVKIENEGEESPAFRTEWFVDNRSQETTDGPSYTPRGKVPGTRIKAVITPYNSIGDGPPFETGEVVIAHPEPVIDSIQLQPSLVSTSTRQLTAVPFFHLPQPDDLQLIYRWEVEGRLLPDTTKTINLSEMKVNSLMRVSITPVIEPIRGKTSSLVIKVVNGQPIIKSVQPLAQDNGYRYQINASDPENDKIIFQLISAPAGSSLDQSNGILILPKSAAGQTVRIKVIDSFGNFVENNLEVGK